MNIIGKWKMDAMFLPLSEEKTDWIKVSEIDFTDEKYEDIAMMPHLLHIFNADHTVQILMPIPEDTPQEVIDEEVKNGAVVVDGKYIVIEESHWKEENGKIYYDTKAQGTIFDEEVSPWVEMKELSDGTVEFEVSRIARISD